VSPGTDQALTPRITRSPFTIPDSCSRSKIRYALGTGIPRSVAITAVKADLRATFPLLHEIVYVWSPAGHDEHSVISLDNVVTIPTSLLGRTVGFLTADQEAHLGRAVVLAYDLDIALLGT